MTTTSKTIDKLKAGERVLCKSWDKHLNGGSYTDEAWRTVNSIARLPNGDISLLFVDKTNRLFPTPSTTVLEVEVSEHEVAAAERHADRPVPISLASEQDTVEVPVGLLVDLRDKKGWPTYPDVLDALVALIPEAKPRYFIAEDGTTIIDRSDGSAVIRAADPDIAALVLGKLNADG